MSSTAPARLSKAERTRRQILAAAELRFAAAGFDKTRLDDVAKDIGMVGSTILYHYPDKRELYRAVLESLTADLLGAIEAAIDAPAPPRERLVELVRAAARKIAERPTIATIALREATSDERELTERSGGILERVVELFEEGAREGEIRPVHAEPYLFFTSIAGAILYTVASLPSMIEEHPDAPRADDAAHRLERDAVAMAQRLLGLSEPRPV
ncbi:MAG: TetR/AcrR family transcriptional regulator [Myxococcota bacterium]